MLQRLHDKEDEKLYYYDSILLKNKKTAAIRISWCYSYVKKNKDINIWNVGFGIAKKKKHIKAWLNCEEDTLTNQITGDGDIEGLIWAKNKLKEFEEELTSISGSHKIIIGWEDNRRRDVYTKYLTKKLNYYSTCEDGYKCLMKNINF